jgi:beta-galactosidase
MWYGGDYNPEQWDEPVWDEDLRLMREAGVTLVTVGVFAWSRLEPRPGRYDFAWLDRVLDRLHDNGIRVALATPTASPPPWFSFAHPDALPVGRDGVRLTHGSRDTYCPSAPAYRAAARGIATQLGRRYGRHPALALWHVHNEYATTCYCDHSAAAFRGWLADRYGSLDRLNRAWTGAFWSQLYGEWDHVLPPRATQYLGNPTQLLDFRRFTSDALLACYTDQRDVLRSLSPGVPITTNFVLGPWVPVDHRRWAAEVDLVAIDHYPDSAEPLRAEEQTALAADRARGWARGRPWLLMESAPNLIHARGHMRPRSPERNRRISLSHVARGSRGALFFQWRAPRGGAEQFHSAMVPHAGPASPTFAGTVELGRLLATPGLAAAATARVVADVALVDNADSGWALQGPGLPSSDLDRERVVSAVHSALWRAGITVDVVAATDDLTPYRLVVVPALYLTTDAEAAAITSYVEDGGEAVVTGLSGVVDGDNQVRLGGHPGAFRALLGVAAEELAPSTVTRRRFGRGTAWYVPPLLADLPAAVGLAPRSAVGLELVRRVGAGAGWLFAINHTETPHELAVTGVDVLTGERADGRWRLEPGAVAVFREDAPPAPPARPRAAGRSRDRRRRRRNAREPR